MIERPSIEIKYTKIALIFSGILTFSIFLFCSRYSNYGYDFSDEAFYLTWILDPSRYNIHIPLSFFGLIYHPLYEITQGNTTTLRLLNMAITFLPAWVLSFLVLKRVLPEDQLDRTTIVILSAGTATAASGYFALWWLVTPSYNSLTFQGMLVTFIGLLEARGHWSWRSALGWLLVALGGWLVFMAKPSTAAIMAPAALAYLLATGRRDVRVLGLTVALALLLVFISALLMDRSPSDFAQRIMRSVNLLGTLGSGQEFGKIFRIDSLPVGGREYWVALALILGLVICANYLTHPLAQKAMLIASGLIASVALTMLLWDGSFVIRFGACVMLAIPAAGLIFSIQRKQKNFRKNPNFALAILFFAAPHIYAFGTNGNYWSHGSGVYLFWALSGIILFSQSIREKNSSIGISSLVLLLQALTACLLVQGVDAPYRQERSFREPHVPWNVRDEGVVMLSPAFRNYLAAARQSAVAAGFKSGTGMIDLTGRSPGVLYDLGARSLGQPWLVGDYPGSDTVANAALRTETCEALTSAWLLVEPSGPRRLSVGTILRSWGADINGYNLVGSFETAQQAGGYAERYEQQLFRPNGHQTVSVAMCEQARIQQQALN
jgi:hypothetical protein